MGRVVITDTVAPKETGAVIEVCSITPTLAAAIACMHNDKPVAPITGPATANGRRLIPLPTGGRGRRKS